MTTEGDDDFIGLAFGYQSPSHFYLVEWKQTSQKYWRTSSSIRPEATSGIEIKVIILTILCLFIGC